MSESFSWRQPCGEPEISILIAGDTNVQNRDNPEDAFRDVQATLSEADAVVGQLECPFAADPERRRAGSVPYKSSWVHSAPEMVDAFSAGNFKAVGCAGNVLYGPDLVASTVATLDRAGIAHSGAGMTLEEARAPAVFSVGGLTVGLLSRSSIVWPAGHAATTGTAGIAPLKGHTAYQPGPRALEMPATPPIIRSWPDEKDLADLVADIRKLKDQADLVLVSFHWGVSGSDAIAEYQRTTAAAAVEAGADLIFGHHPHVIQGAELIGKVPVFYSLGNFAFDWEVMRTKRFDGLLVRLTASADGLSSVSCVPVRRDESNQIRIQGAASSPQGVAIAERFLALSQRLGSDFRIDGDEIGLLQRGVSV